MTPFLLSRMQALSSDWFMQNWLDSEYQQYVVMAYLQSVNTHFSNNQLHPALPDLREHYKAGVAYMQGKGALRASFPRRVRGIKGPPPRIDYVSDIPDDTFLSEIETTLEFALPRFRQAVADGEQRWADISGALTLEPVGLLPLQPEEGYLFIYATQQRSTDVYHFRLTLYDDQLPGGRVVRFRYVESVQQSLVYTLEQIKLDLIRRHRQLPNPATFRLESKQPLPVAETLLPIANQLLVQAVT